MKDRNFLNWKIFLKKFFNLTKIETLREKIFYETYKTFDREDGNLRERSEEQVAEGHANRSDEPRLDWAGWRMKSKFERCSGEGLEKIDLKLGWGRRKRKMEWKLGFCLGRWIEKFNLGKIGLGRKEQNGIWIENLKMSKSLICGQLCQSRVYYNLHSFSTLSTLVLKTFTSALTGSWKLRWAYFPVLPNALLAGTKWTGIKKIVFWSQTKDFLSFHWYMKI